MDYIKCEEVCALAGVVLVNLKKIDRKNVFSQTVCCLVKTKCVVLRLIKACYLSKNIVTMRNKAEKGITPFKYIET